MAQTANISKKLLLAGALAGPLYVGVGLLEMLLREGFDIRRHSLSLMSNGEWGWIHIALLLFTGLLTIAGAIGLRKALRGTVGGTWAPILLIVYGLGLVGAGIFVADPMDGFPVGTPAGTPEMVTMAGLLHLALGGIGFLGLIAACFVLARKFSKLGQKGFATFSIITGIAYFAAFFGIAMGSQQGPETVATVNIAFSFAVILAWTWLTLIFLKFKKES
ncbi:MAG TPA: DUF998 domain-containing protein [Candidatus Saccharimonadales bacterium]|nr:DUF998 domain-containing protein [Candidatus Saccharimonadales bacterium]